MLAEMEGAQSSARISPEILPLLVGDQCRAFDHELRAAVDLANGILRGIEKVARYPGAQYDALNALSPRSVTR